MFPKVPSEAMKAFFSSTLFLRLDLTPENLRKLISWRRMWWFCLLLQCYRQWAPAGIWNADDGMFYLDQCCCWSCCGGLRGDCVSVVDPPPTVAAPQDQKKRSFCCKSPLVTARLCVKATFPCLIINSHFPPSFFHLFGYDIALIPSFSLQTVYWQKIFSL